MDPAAKKNAGYTAVGAVFLLAYGWLYSTVGVSDNQFYNATVSAFNWMLRGGGLLMLIISGMCYAGLRLALLLDFIVSGLCGLLMMVCAAYWMSQDGINLRDGLILLFGLLFARAALSSWSIYGAPQVLPASVEPVSPSHEPHDGP
jgi:hypothetical protein